MGLDIFDALSAAGAGLGAIGARKDEERKLALATKLEQDREARADQYKVNAENRQEGRELKEVKTTEMQHGEGGIAYMVTKNKDGDLLSKDLATPDQIADETYKDTKREAEINLMGYRGLDAAARAQLNGAKADSYPAMTDSRIGLNDAKIAKENSTVDVNKARVRRLDNPIVKPVKQGRINMDIVNQGRAESLKRGIPAAVTGKKLYDAGYTAEGKLLGYVPEK